MKNNLYFLEFFITHRNKHDTSVLQSWNRSSWTSLLLQLIQMGSFFARCKVSTETWGSAHPSLGSTVSPGYPPTWIHTAPTPKSWVPSSCGTPLINRACSSGGFCSTFPSTILLFSRPCISAGYNISKLKILNNFRGKNCFLFFPAIMSCSPSHNQNENWVVKTN